MLTKETAKPQSATKLESEHTVMHPKKAKVNDEVTCRSPCVSSENQLETNVTITKVNLDSTSDFSLVFFPNNEQSQSFMCSVTNLPLVVKHCLKPSKPLGTPSRLIEILGDGNCLFRALSYAVTGRQVYHSQMRAQIINHMKDIKHFLLPHMNTSLDNYLANSQMANNGVWGTDIEILSAASLLSTDIFVYTQFGDAYKWLKFSRTMIDGKKPENSCSIYLNHSNTIHYDVVQDVCVTDLNQSDDIHACHEKQKQTKSMLTKETAKPQSAKRKLGSEHTTMHPKKAKVNDEVTCRSPCVSSEDQLETNVTITKVNLDSTSGFSFVFFPNNEQSQGFMCSVTNLPLVVKHCLKPSKPLGTPSRLIEILGDGNCLFRALSYAVTGRQVYHSQMRAQIINHMKDIEDFLLPYMNTSLDNYLANSQMANNGVWGTDIEILSAASLLSTDIFVYTQFGDAYKWLKFSRTMIDGKKPENSCSIYLNHSNTIHYDVVQDVCVNDLNQSDDIHSYSKRKEPIAKKTSQSTFHREQTQTKNMITKETAEKRKRKSQHSTITHSKKHKLVDDQVSCDLSNTSQNDYKMANMVNETKKNIHSTIPEIKKPKIKKTQSHVKNQNCSQTKTKSKIQKQKNVFSKLKNVQGNRKTDDKHKKVPMKSNEIDKLALKNMTTFHKSLDYTIYQCKNCFEAWPQKTKIRKNSKKTLSNYVCTNCLRDKQFPKKFSKENHMVPSSVPKELQGLTQIEEMLIARALPIMRVFIKPGGQRGYSGHCINLPQDVKELAKSLPRYPKDIPFILVKMTGKYNSCKQVTVRRHNIQEALHWLTLHNPQYSDVTIDQHALNCLPENGIPSDLPTFETKNDDKNSDQDSLIETELESDSDVVYNKDTQTSSFLPFQHNGKQEKEEIQEEIAKKIFDWPSVQNKPFNEYTTPFLATMAFPTLFPDGKGDPTNPSLNRHVPFCQSVKHLLKFGEFLNGKWVYRFAKHPRFSYWALNMIQRKRTLQQSSVFIKQNPGDAHVTIEQLHQMRSSNASTNFMTKLSRYVSNITGSNAYWQKRRNELKTIINSKGTPTIFFTFSSADMHWPELHSLFSNRSHN